MKKRILITGGTGFIGSIVREKINSELDCEILSIGRGQGEDIKIDLNSDLENTFKDFLPDIVFHLASGSNISKAEENKEKELHDVVHGTESLIKELTKLKFKPKKIIYLSSQAVYGIPKSLPVVESHVTSPITVYGKNKLEAEKIIVNSGLPYVIFRVSSVYGASQNPEKSGVIAKFINKLKRNESPTVFNSLELYSDFIYVDDLVRAVSVLAGENSNVTNQIYNLGSGKPTTLKTILEILYKYFPSAPAPIFAENSLYSTKEYKGLYLDISKIQSQLKWNCKYNIEDGIRLTLENIKLAEKV